MRLPLLAILIGACGGGPSVPPGGDDDDVPPPDGGGGGGNGGTLSFSWQIDTEPGATCADIGAAQVEILTSNNVSGTEALRRFTCQLTGNGTTNKLPAGSYTVLISLIDSDALSIQTLPSEIHSVFDGDDSNIGFYFFTF